MLDIEASNLDADFGVILSAAIKPYHKPPILFVNKNSVWDDSQVVRDVVSTLNTYDLVVTFYGYRFDVPFLRSRMLKTDPTLTLKPTLHHIDLYYVAKRSLKLHSGSLDAACEFFGIPGKTRLRGEYWIRAAAGDPLGLRYVTTHNRYDVIILEKLYDVLKENVGMIRTI